MVSLATKHDTSESLARLESRFQRKGGALPINFRTEVPWIQYNAQRYTHLLHSYPAKVIPHIPHFFLSAQSLTDPGGVVLDPFSGSGTVALEACLAERNAIASDSNPLARLLTRVKTTAISPIRLSRNIARVRQGVALSRATTAPDVVNLSYWYPKKTITQLTRIAAAIKRIEEPDLRALVQIAFSACVRKASLTDPRISVPVRLNPDRYPTNHPMRTETQDRLRRLRQLDAVELFFNILDNFSDQVASLWPLRSTLGSVEEIYSDSLNRGEGSLAARAKSSVDMIITSPPYLGAQKYVRATSLSLNWLELAKASELRGIEDLSIGREHFLKALCQEPLVYGVRSADRLIAEVHRDNPLRAHIAAKYLSEMRDVLKVCHHVLRPGGSLVLVSGCNSLCGRSFNTTKFLVECCTDIGFTVRLRLSDTIKSRGLMTRRNHTAGLIPTESVVLFSK